MEALKLLKATRELLSDRRRWTSGTGARDSFGVACTGDDRDARSWCSIAAVARVNGGSITLMHPAFGYLCKGFGVPDESDIAIANDSRSHDEVLVAFDRAIALAEEDSEGAPLPAVETTRELIPA